MRCVYLIPKIYGHRLETLCSENGMAAHRDQFFEMYEALKEREFALYYEYNYPTQGHFTAVLAVCESTDAEGNSDNKAFSFRADASACSLHTASEPEGGSGFNAAAAAGILNAEFTKEAFRLISELVSREMRSSLGKIDYPEKEKKARLLDTLYERWEKLPAGLFDKEETLLCPAALLFQSTLGLRLGCSGGGSCSSCTHPTCGYRSA